MLEVLFISIYFCEMLILNIFVVILVTAWPTASVRLDMHGSVSLGKQVLDTLSSYLNAKNINGRRSMKEEFDTKTAETVTAAAICKGLKICHEKEEFVNEYITLIGNSIENIFDGIVKPKGFRANDKNAPRLSKGDIFEDPLKALLHDFRKLFRAADSKLTKEREAFIWIDLLKKISARFHDSTFSFIHRRIDGDPAELKDVKSKIIQKLVLAISIVEYKFEQRLCSEYDLCDKQLEVTIALRRFFEHFVEMTEARTRVFMQYFYESLPDTLHFLTEETANDFQAVLKDMIYDEKVPTKEILLSILKTIDDRLSIVKNKSDLKKPYDVLLAHVILSDLDHFYYGKQRENHFEPFLSYFNDWSALGGRFHSQITSVLKSLRDHLQSQPGELYMKIRNEVSVFLELTVNSEQ